MLCVISFDPFCSSLGTNRGAKNDLFVRKVDLPSSFSLVQLPSLKNLDLKMLVGRFPDLRLIFFCSFGQMIWTIEILRGRLTDKLYSSTNSGKDEDGPKWIKMTS